MGTHRLGGRSRGALVTAVVAVLAVAAVAGVMLWRHSTGSAALVVQGRPASTSPTPASGTSASVTSPSAGPTVPPVRTSAATPARSTRSSPATRSKPATSRRTTSARTTAATRGGSATCTKPVFTTSDTNGGWSTNGYYVHNNVWNAAEAGPESLHACSYRNWYTVTNQRDLAGNRGSVKAYPNVHKDYDGERISSFSEITSTFAASSPHLGIYNVAYDIWLNGIADDGSAEIMIWTENFKQVPSGDKVTRAAFRGVTYDVWKTGDNGYVAFVPTKVMTSGSLDLLAMFKWLMGKGWLASTSTMGQVGFGVEVVSTEGKDARFSVTDFSVTDR